VDFQEYFKKMCGTPDEVHSVSFKVDSTTTPFNKKELRWLKDQLQACIDYSDPGTNKRMYASMMKKVDERLVSL
jgi:hypothetical protein